MLLGFPRHLCPFRSWVFSAIRLSSSENKASRSTRRKGKAPAKEQKHFPSPSKIAPPTSQLLEDFLVGGSQRLEGKQRNLKNLDTTEPPGDEKSFQGSRPTERPVQAQEKGAIKFTDLFRDFVNAKGQPSRELTQVTARPVRRSVRIRHIEPLPLPAKLNLFDEASFEESAATTGDYNNEVFKEVEALEASAYRAKSTHNKFEELIQWTLDGKLWRYPIDNEQDWKEELHTPFHEHVFLNRFEEGRAGAKKPAPLKAFMELVCAGLGQNPYLSVEEKRDHIVWFEGYFADKLKDIESAVEEERRVAEAELKARGANPTCKQ